MWTPLTPADYVCSEKELIALNERVTRVKHAIFTSLEVIPQPLKEAICLEACHTLVGHINTVKAGLLFLDLDALEEDDRYVDHTEELEKLMNQVAVPASLEEGINDGMLEVYTMLGMLRAVPAKSEEMVMSVHLVQLNPLGDILDQFEIFFVVDLLDGSLKLDTARFRVVKLDGRDF